MGPWARTAGAARWMAPGFVRQAQVRHAGSGRHGQGHPFIVTPVDLFAGVLFFITVFGAMAALFGSITAFQVERGVVNRQATPSTVVVEHALHCASELVRNEKISQYMQSFFFSFFLKMVKSPHNSLCMLQGALGQGISCPPLLPRPIYL
jgi:hypothetical protein